MPLYFVIQIPIPYDNVLNSQNFREFLLCTIKQKKTIFPLIIARINGGESFVILIREKWKETIFQVFLYFSQA